MVDERRNNAVAVRHQNTELASCTGNAVVGQHEMAFAGSDTQRPQGVMESSQAGKLLAKHRARQQAGLKGGAG